jgi:hypothetical protein
MVGQYLPQTNEKCRDAFQFGTMLFQPKNPCKIQNVASQFSELNTPVALRLFARGGGALWIAAYLYARLWPTCSEEARYNRNLKDPSLIAC